MGPNPDGAAVWGSGRGNDAAVPEGGRGAHGGTVDRVYLAGGGMVPICIEGCPGYLACLNPPGGTTLNRDANDWLVNISVLDNLQPKDDHVVRGALRNRSFYWNRDRPGTGKRLKSLMGRCG